MAAPLTYSAFHNGWQMALKTTRLGLIDKLFVGSWKQVATMSAVHQLGRSLRFPEGSTAAPPLPAAHRFISMMDSASSESHPSSRLPVAKRMISITNRSVIGGEATAAPSRHSHSKFQCCGGVDGFFNEATWWEDLAQVSMSISSFPLGNSIGIGVGWSHRR